MAYDGSIRIDTSIDSSGAKEGLKHITTLSKDGLERITTLSKDGLKSIVTLSKSALKAITVGITAATTAVGAATIAGVKYNAQMEQYITSFGTMLGSAEKAQTLVNDLKEMGAKTPFETADLAKGAQTLLAFGLANEKLLPTMKMIGDVSQGNKEKFDSLTLAFAQISSTGKLTGQDLLQCVNAGFNPLNEISKKTGKSMADLKEEMSKGAISAEMVTEAFKSATSEGGLFYKAMESQSKTFNGQLSTMKDNAMSLIGDMTSGFSDKLKDTALPTVNGWLVDLSDAFKTGGTEGVTKAAGRVLGDAITAAAESAPGIIDSAITLLDSISKSIVRNKKRILTACGTIVRTMADGLADMLPPAMQEPVKEAIAAINKSFKSGGLSKGIDAVIDIIKLLGNAASSVAKVALPLLTGATDLLAGNMHILLPATLAAVGALKTIQVAQSAGKWCNTLATELKTLSIGMSGGVSSATGLTKVISSLCSPTGLFVIAVAAIVGFGAAIYEHLNAPVKAAEKQLDGIGSAMLDFESDLQSAQSNLSDFDEAFAGLNKVQSDAEASSREIQAKITEVLQKGMQDRAQINAADLENLKTYYTQLAQANEIALQQEKAKSNTLAQMLLRDAEHQNGSLEKYKSFTAQSLATMQEQIDKEKSLLDTQFNNEVVNMQMQVDAHTKTQEEFDSWYSARYAQRQQDISSTEGYMGALNAKLTAGFAQQVLQKSTLGTKLSQLNSAEISENERYKAQLAEIDSTSFQVAGESERQRQLALIDHNNKIKSLNRDLTFSLSEEEKSQVATMLKLAKDTKDAGGIIDKETQDAVNTILDSWAELPLKGKGTADDLIKPILEGLGFGSVEIADLGKKTGLDLIKSLKDACGVASPSWKTKEITDYVMQGAEQGLDGRRQSLLGKAASIANNIISTISGAFKVHSPSVVMRDIFGYVMAGAENGLTTNEKSLFATAKEISDGVLSRLSKIQKSEFSTRMHATVSTLQSNVGTRFANNAEYVALQSPSNNFAELTQSLQNQFKQNYAISLTANLDGREIYKNQKAIEENWGYDLGGGKLEW